MLTESWCPACEHGCCGAAGRGAWDATALMARVRDLVVESLGDPEDGVLIVDDTQIIKKGTKSVGWLPRTDTSA